MQNVDHVLYIFEQVLTSSFINSILKYTSNNKKIKIRQHISTNVYILNLYDLRLCQLIKSYNTTVSIL